MVCFEREDKDQEIAAALKIRERPVERWRRAWREQGETGLLSAGSPGRPVLSPAQVDRLARELKRDRWSTAGQISGGRWRV
ncbi:hypothetical protein AB0D86_49545 [Streptomyces sp. NPDC048324]|uniref:hypothetical protein n=1 Tax=Streptomyces sp. NPDC048324 TaxID=3157205 RepID=UPI00343BB2CD